MSEGRIASTDALIDQIVYRLYGLTEEEIAVVEGKTTTADGGNTRSGPAVSSISGIRGSPPCGLTDEEIAVAEGA